MSTGELVAGAVYVAGFLFVGATIYHIVEQSTNREKFVAKLLKSGFSIDFLLNGSILVVFDDTRKRVAFIARDGVFQFGYGSVSKWNWVWVERDGRRINNHIQFYLRDKKMPLIQTEVSEHDAQLWHAKLEAIFNG